MHIFGRRVLRTTVLTVGAWIVFIAYVFVAIFGMSLYVYGRVIIGFGLFIPTAVFTWTSVSLRTGVGVPRQVREAIAAVEAEQAPQHGQN